MKFNLITFLKTIPIDLKTFSFSLFLLIIIGVGSPLLLEYFEISIIKESDKYNVDKLFDVIFIIVIIPVLETLLFTYFPYYVVSKFSKSTFLFVAITSLLFGLMHTYSIYYMLITFFAGIILNTFFWIVIHKKNMKHAFFLTALMHALYNFFIFLINVFAE